MKKGLSIFLLVSAAAAILALVGLSVSAGPLLPRVPVRGPTPAAAMPLEWDPLNGPYESVVFALTGTSNGDLYAGTFGQGLYGSSNTGQTWMEKGRHSESFKALITAPSASRFVFAGTFGQGLLKSTNGGTTLDPLGGNSPLFAIIDNSHTARSPKSIESLLFLADDSATWAGSALLFLPDLKDAASLVMRLKKPEEPISEYLRAHFSPYLTQSLEKYKSGMPSQDLQETLVKELNGILRAGALYDPQRYAGISLSDRTQNLVKQNPQGDGLVRLNRLLLDEIYPDQIGASQRLIIGTHNGVWFSDDYGDTINPLDCALPESSDDAYNVQTLTHDSAGHVYAGTLDGLYRCQDSSVTAQRLGPTANLPAEANQILALSVVTEEANKADILLIGTKGAGVYTATLNSNSTVWIPANTGLPDDSRARTIQVFLATSTGKVYAGTIDFGIFESDDYGQTWTQIVDGLPSDSRSILSLAYRPQDRSLCAGTYGAGVYCLSSQSSTWEPADTGIASNFPVQKISFIDRASGEVLLTGIRVGGLYSTTLSEQNSNSVWARLYRSLPVGPARDVTGLVNVGPPPQRVIAATGLGIFRSNEDLTDSWTPITATLPRDSIRVKAVAQGHNKDVVYAILEDKEPIYHSKDGGLTWQPTAASITPTLFGQFPSIAVGADDHTVYVGLLAGEMFASHNDGDEWQRLTPITDTLEIPELAWSRSNWLEQLLFDSYPESLYARTDKGLYVSHDGGTSWQLRQRSTFDTMLVDPNHSGAVYAAAPSAALNPEARDQIALRPDVWVSYDQGDSWKWAGPVASSITALAIDPNNPTMLYAGTQKEGVFRALLPAIPYRFSTKGIVLVVTTLAALVLIMMGLVISFDTGRHFARPYHLPLKTWPRLIIVRFRHATQLNLVAADKTTLTSLECLTLACPRPEPFKPEALLEKLEEAGAVPTLPQLGAALDGLLDNQLLHRREGVYRSTQPILTEIARARFWTPTDERQKLIEDVRRESTLRTDTRRLFEWAGLNISTADTGLRALSSSREYRLLHDNSGFYIHFNTFSQVKAEDIDQAWKAAQKAYGGKSAEKIAFLMASGALETNAYQRMAALKHTDHFSFILCTQHEARQASDMATARRTIRRLLERALGNQDLLELNSPAYSPLDFFNREEDIDRLAARLPRDRVIGLEGIMQIGKTSLAWQLLNRLPNTVSAWLNLSETSAIDLHITLRRAWINDARLKFPGWEQPEFAAVAEPSATQQTYPDLILLRNSLRSEMTQLHLVAFLDELTDLTSKQDEIQNLVRFIRSTEGFELVGISSSQLSDAGFSSYCIKPLDQTESIQMLASLTAQMEIDFQDAALDRIYQAAGGHPRLLRQIAQLAIRHAGDITQPIGIVEADAAIADIVTRPGTVLEQLWDSLGEMGQKLVRAAIHHERIVNEDLLAKLTEAGWLTENRQVFSLALEQWLKSHFPG